MKKRITICALLMLCLLMPQEAAGSEDPMYEQIIRFVFSENLPEIERLTDASSDILSLKLQSAFNTDMNYTYEDGWMLTGTADPGTHVGVIVYTISEKGTPIIWYDRETVIGESRLYQEKVPLQLLDVQKLLIVVHTDTRCAVREYQVLRKSDEICNQLLEYELNLYEEYGQS